MQNNKKILLTVLLSFVFLLATMSFTMAATTIVKPVTNTNYTGTVNVTVTTAQANVGNVTCWYDPLGGTAYVYWLRIQNTSAGQTWFSNPTVSISALADKLTYKVICGVFNPANSNVENSTAVTNIGFDNTAPVVTLSLLSEKLNAGNTQEITWTSSDATAGLTSTSVTATSPDTDNCPVQTWTTATGTHVQIATDGGVASCTGTWTVLVTATDKAGNIGTSTATFTMEDVAGKRVGYLDSLGSTLGTDTTGATGAKKGISPIVLIIAGIIIYFLFFSKKRK